MFFDRWSDVGRVLAMGLAAYVVMVAVLRVSGKRTLAKLNAFDLVVTVALGSVLATIALSSEVSLIEGVAAIVVLIVAQLTVAWSSVHLPALRALIRSEPTVVVRDGEIVESALRSSRLTSQELMQAVRASGSGSFDAIAAVVLETDGSLSVITREQFGSGDALPGEGRASADR